MIILLLLILFSVDIFTAGFARNTLLLTNRGQITFNEVDCDTLFQSNENYFQSVLFLGNQSVEKVIQITFADELVTCHSKQVFWCVNKNDWICAKDLNIGDLLRTIDGKHISIDKVQKVQQQTEIYSLSVGPPHYLYVGKDKILAHNMPWFVGVGIELALECGAIEFLRATFAFAIGAIALHFAKNTNNNKTKASVTIAPVCNSPQFDPDDHKNKKNKEDLVDKKFTTEELVKIAKDMGFEKTNYKSNGQTVFKKGNRYISRDIDSHNGGVWKMANSVKNLGRKATRIGTYDVSLNWIGK